MTYRPCRTFAVSLVAFARDIDVCALQVGLPGLATDVITMKELLTFRLNLYRLREEREIKPETFSALMSHILYQKRSVDVAEPSEKVQALHS